MRRFSHLLVVLSVALAACAGSDSTTTSPLASTSTLAVTTTSGPVVSGTFTVNGHDLYIHCTGSDSPTFLLEAGEGEPGSALAVYQDALTARGTVCSYDRANTGGSGSAPTPRTAAEVASDLNELLTAASIGGPYVLLGQSAGGMMVQFYARQFPDDVIAVVAMNPVPPYQEWFDQGVPLMAKSIQADEAAYYEGANGESLDYRASSRQIDEAPPPPDVPFALLLSTIAQCENPPEDVCSITYRAYEDIMQGVAEGWPRGEFIQFEAGHLLPPDKVMPVIDRILEP